ncbi:MAG: hypothetical protein V1725_05910 [archaeon]
MKIESDKTGRRTYKFSHSTAQGGNLYAHKVKQGTIENKEGLKNALHAVSVRFKLIDPTVKVYDTIFLFFFHIPKALAPAELIDSIQKNTDAYADWDEEYLFTGVYDLQEKYIRKDLEQWELDYDQG